MTVPIKSASASEQEKAIAAIVPAFVRAFGGNALAHGASYYAGGFAGAALWLPPDVHQREEEMDALLQQRALPAGPRDWPRVLGMPLIAAGITGLKFMSAE